MKIIYEPEDVCSRLMEIEVEDGVIQSVAIRGGCDGNTKGVAKLLEGMRAEDAIEKMKGIRCGRKMTSCPDQLAVALGKYVNSNA
ncbi:MAG: TIGR03905 family TSCPD domain-containing protein [Oscillospiraceae bacterium]|nr:TIGR03905 family TSCPD domain-containing protein [Oscillospiraceae bacterium]